MAHEVDTAKPLRIDLVGRKIEMDAIRAALDDHGQTHILVFQGPGGIGKTYLLEAALDLLKEADYSSLQTSGLIDLFLSKMHSNAGIEQAIIEGLAPKSFGYLKSYLDARAAQSEEGTVSPDDHFDKDDFQEYLVKRAEYERLQREGIGARRLEELRATLNQTFIRNFNAFSEKHRVLLTFDTAESIQYEPEAIQKICRVDQGDQTVAAKDWILTVLPHLANAVILIAGRESYRPEAPPLPLWADIDQTLKKEADAGYIFYTKRSLSKLNKKEALAYFDEMIETARREGYSEIAEQLEAIGTEEDAKQRIYHYSEGRPVRLSMLIDFARWGKFPPGEQTPSAETKKQLEKDIVEGIRQFQFSSNMQTALRVLIAAQIGVDANLLHHLEGWSLKQCHETIQELLQLSFIKRRESSKGEQIISLHDEIFDMLFAHFADQPVQEYGLLWKKAAAYYQSLYDNTPQHKDEARRNTGVALLHYRLRADPKDGYDYYLRTTTHAIYEHDAGYDMALRDERIRFFNNPILCEYANNKNVTQEKVQRDSTVHWVERHIAQNRREAARQVIESVLHFAPQKIRQIIPDALETTSPPPSEIEAEAQNLYQTDDIVFWARLLRGYAQVLTYQGYTNEKILRHLLRGAEMLLKNRRDDLRDKDEPLPWSLLLTLGQVRSQLGYLNRTVGRYNAALIAYRNAERQLREITGFDAKQYLAQTLNDKAFVQANTGRPELSQRAISEALQIREARGGKFRLALTKNTWSLIATYNGRPDQAIDSAAEALALFQNLDDQRGIGLAHIASGIAHRRYAEQWKPGYCDVEEAETHYEKAQEHLEEAIKIFSNPKYREPLQLWQAYSDMGSTHIDMAFLYLDNEDVFPEQTEKKRQKLRDSAEKNFRQALAIVEESERNPQHIDTYEDLAQVYADAGKLDKAKELLTKAESLIDPAYHLKEGEGFQQIPEPQDIYWVGLGKIHQQRGIETLKRLKKMDPTQEAPTEQLKEAARNLAFSYAYFNHAWAASKHTEQLLARVEWHGSGLRGQWRQIMHDVAKQIGEDYAVDTSDLQRTLWLPTLDETFDLSV